MPGAEVELEPRVRERGRGLLAHPPAAAVAELVGAQLAGLPVLLRPRPDRPVGEALGARCSEVGLGSRDSGRGALAVAPASAPPGRRPASLSSSRITCSLLGVVALAEVHVAHPSLGIDEVRGRPVLVLVRLPDRVVVVLDHRIAEAVLGDRVAHVRLVALERELRRVHAHDHEPGPPVAPVPRLQVRQRADAVDAGVGPEVDQHRVAAQPVERQRAAARRVEPPLRSVESGRDAEHRQRLSLRVRPRAAVGTRGRRGGPPAARSPLRSPRAPSTGSRGRRAGRSRSPSGSAGRSRPA